MLIKASMATILSLLVLQFGYIRYFQLYSGDRQGNGTKIQMASGTPVSGNLVKYDANGNVTDAGVQPGGSSIPSGLIAFFNGGCPSGWGVFTALNGRYVVGVTGPYGTGTPVGTALSLEEDRAVSHHSHVVYDPGHYHPLPSGWSYTTFKTAQDYFDLNGWSGFTLSNYPPSSTATTTGITLGYAGSVSGTNAPYLTLRPCVKN